MKPLNENMNPSSPLPLQGPVGEDRSTISSKEMNQRYNGLEGYQSPFSHIKRRRNGRRRGILSSCPQNLCLLIYLSSLLHPSTAQQQQRHRALSPTDALHRTLADGRTECADCPNNDKFLCQGKTITPDDCKPCATGQSWWPCNLVDECYCQDLAAKAAEEARLAEEEANFQLGIVPCDVSPCEPGETAIKPVPFRKCREYVQCSNGVPGTVQKCSAGMLFSPSIQACNVPSLVSCPTFTCPPTLSPTGSPTTSEPTGSSGSSIVVGGGTDLNSGKNPGESVAPPPAPPVNIAQQGAPAPNTDTSAALIDPSILEGMHVMDAHIAANKIALTRELLSSPGGMRQRGNNRNGSSSSNTASNNNFSYMGFRSSLHTMITSGVANSTFYIGTSNGNNGRAYGLVNIAAFLAMSAEDSIMHGSCDEVNSDLVGGVLPISNACGQYGLDYQDQEKTCGTPEEEALYACPVDPAMRLRANDIDVSSYGYNDDPPPKPFYCGPTSDYEGGYTGHWDYVSETESYHPAVENESGRQDVEGCCWWGRGAIQLRGTCAYGKLNYHMGKRAHDEGRPSMYPDVDFCMDPQAVCSHPNYPDLKWMAGFFRWITEIQSYNHEEFNYMQRLIDFVDGGLRDWTFIHSLSGIVTQGCHQPPCIEGAEFDGSDRKATFIRTLRLLGLTVNEGAATGR